AASSAAGVERIRHRWQQAGLAPWMAPAHEWAWRFDGIERLAGEPRLAPTLAVWRLALRYARRRRNRSDVQVAIALAMLPFARWRARWPAWAAAGRGERWDPLEQTLREFIARGASQDELLVWEGARPTVPIRRAVPSLLARLHAAGRPL
ncbi:MAG: hypothetical protein ACK4V1_09425, partial [Burkholderiaceae bacterium]